MVLLDCHQIKIYKQITTSYLIDLQTLQDIQMTKVTPSRKQVKTFLNAKQSVDLPSNLLNTNGRYPRTLDNINYFAKRRPNSISPESSIFQRQRMKQQKYFKDLKTPKIQSKPVIIEQKNQRRQKDVLYKRLSGIRDNNTQINNLSFSKMLSRMVIMGQNQESPNQHSYDFRMRQTSYVRPIRQKQLEFQLDGGSIRNKSSFSKTSDFGKFNSIQLTPRDTAESNRQQKQSPSKRLFKKYYLPNSELAQTIFLETINPDDKYVYQNGKRVQCKRIHNFYTSNMFRNGYDRCFRKTAGDKGFKKF